MKKLAYSMSLGYMTKNDIRYWSKQGIDFGIHTVTHPCLTALDEKAIYEEVSKSKKELEVILEKPVNCFAYPYGNKGDFNEVTRSVLKKIGINIGMTFEPGTNLSDTDFLELYRMAIAGNIDFKLACYGLTRFVDIFKEMRNGL